MTGVAARRRSTPRVDYETLADLRYHIRRFLRVREEAARAAGVEPQQYLLLLQVKGFERREPATIGALTERLQIRHHATVQLVDRLTQRGMVRRRRAKLARLHPDSCHRAERRRPAATETPRSATLRREPRMPRLDNHVGGPSRRGGQDS
jgi:hypothetical protein